MPDDRPPEQEPDYRFSLANERTLLAYLRTAMALMAGGVVLLQLTPHAAPRALAYGLIVAGLAVALLSHQRWHAVQRAMRRAAPMPHPILPAVIAAVLAAAALVFLIARP